MTTQPTRTLVCVPICVCDGLAFFFFSFSPSSCSVTGARHAVISQALWEQGYGTILTPGPTSPSPDKGFSPTRKSFKPVKDQRARSVKTSPEAALLPLLLLSVWLCTGCDALTGLVFTTAPKAAIRVHSLFISQVSLKLIYRIIFAATGGI